MILPLPCGSISAKASWESRNTEVRFVASVRSQSSSSTSAEGCGRTWPCAVTRMSSPPSCSSAREAVLATAPPGKVRLDAHREGASLRQGYDGVVDARGAAHGRDGGTRGVQPGHDRRADPTAAAGDDRPPAG